MYRHGGIGMKLTEKQKLKIREMVGGGRKKVINSEKQARHLEFKKARMKRLKKKDVSSRFKEKATKENGVFVIRTINKRTGRPVEIRNKSRVKALRDLATISGYLVE